MPVVTISRQFGAGGHTLGEHLAKKFGYQLVDRDIIREVAKEANVSADWVEAIEKDAGGLLLKVTSSLVSSNFIERLLGESASDFDEKKYVQFVQKVITQAAARGNVVLVGRGGQFVLPDGPQTIKILLVAELSDRIKFMMDHYNLTRSRAELVVRKEEKRRQTFLSIFSPRNPDDPSLYSICLNTSRISLDEALAMACDLVEACPLP